MRVTRSDHAAHVANVTATASSGIFAAEPWEDGPPAGFDDDDGPESAAGPGERRSSGVRVAPQHSVRLDPARLAENIDETIIALAEDPEVYAQGAQLVRVVRAESTDERGRIIKGTPSVRPLLIATLRERLTKVCRFQRWVQRGEHWVDVAPPDPLLQGLLARCVWPGVRELVGVIEAPSLRPDGSVVQEPGYDSGTRYLYAPTVRFPEVPEQPTQADARHALRDLCEVFVDFPFTTEAARMVPVAATMSIIVRPAITSSVPAFVFDAPTPGMGKSLLADASSTIATGRSSPRATFPEMNRGKFSKVNVEELEKILGSYALQSAAVVGFDNIGPCGFGGAPLDKVLTSYPDVDLRVLGRSEQPRVLWRAVILATGNNVAILDDTVRRVLVARQECAHERPEERTGFKHSPLLPWVVQERPRLVVAALTIVRAFILAGRPQDPSIKPFGGGFESWERLIPHAIAFAGGANVLLARPGDDATAANDLGSLAAILEAWERLQGDQRGITAKSAVELLYPPGRRRGEGGPPDGYEAAREAIEELTCPRPGDAPSAKALGDQLRRFKSRVVGGRRLVCRPDRTGVQRWSVEGGGA